MIYSRPILENKIYQIISRDNFYKFCCALFFLLSIFIRSLMDIGPDSSVYLDVGKKLALGKDYYNDIFEINFPITMWFYEWQYKLSLALKISPIIIMEVIVNFCALLSIYFTAKNLKKTLFLLDKNLYKLVIISFFLGFFLRPYSIQLLEFGTKTSYFLILFYPYFSYCLIKRADVTKIDLITKGVLMALIVSLKPHYLFFILVIEFYLLFTRIQPKYNLKQYFYDLLSLDKLTAISLYLLYILLILKQQPLFFEYLVPMWSNYFKIYTDFSKLLTNFYSNIAFLIFPYSAVFLIFTRYKMTEIDKLFLVIFIASALSVLLENIFTIDQFALFCAINLTLMLRIIQIILRNNFLNFSENLFFLGFFIIIPFSQSEFIRLAIFSYSGAFNLWWLILWYNFIFLYKKSAPEERRKIFNYKNIIGFFVAYLSSIALVIYGFKGANFWLSNFISLTAFFIFYYFLEKYLFYKTYPQLTRLTTFMVMASIFAYVHDYGNSIGNLVNTEGFRSKFRQIYDFKAYYYKEYAPQNNHHEINFYNFHQLAHPVSSYFNKEMPQKMSIFSMNANVSRNRILFYSKNPQENFVFGYIVNDLKKMMRDKNTKLIFIDNIKINEKESNKCIIGYLEYLFFDKEIKSLFLKNFQYKNRLIATKNYQISDDFWNDLFSDKNDDKYKINGDFQKIITDIEVYVRKN